MPFQIVRNDITKMVVDAIVNAANNTLLGGGGVDGAIHHAAGPGLLAECATLNGCATGAAKITGGYELPAKYVIHTVGPVYHDGAHGEPDLLASCYRESLRIAAEHGCASIAFPLISAGVYGYPHAAAIDIAISEIKRFLLASDTDMLVYLVIFDRFSYAVGTKFQAIKSFIDENYVAAHSDSDSLVRSRQEAAVRSALPDTLDAPSWQINAAESASLDDILDNLEDSFSELLLRKIDERGMTDAECYKRANIDRKLFAKIRKNKAYHPSKVTVIALAIALELPYEELDELLERAGFALSHADKFDVIVEYFFKKQIYDVFQINEALFEFHQNLICA